MFFGESVDGDEDFTAALSSSTSRSSKLASLFDIDRDGTQSGNESLTYTAPKDPKKKRNGADSMEKPETGPSALNAAPVQAYKLIDGKYTSQGKIGAAIIGNHSQCSYKLLLYISKQQQVTNATINAGFSFNIQPQNYASFYDDARQNWSIMFNSQQNLADFARQVALSKAGSGGVGLLVSQDLVLGEGGGLEAGDSAEVKYTGWLLDGHVLGQVLDSNCSSEKLLRFRLGKGKVAKGWDEGLLHMARGGQRMLVVPSSMATGGEGRVPKMPTDAPSVWEIEMVRVKLQKEKDSVAEVQHSDVSSVASDSEGVKARSRSIEEQLTQPESPKSEKAKLISRMARMGKPMVGAALVTTDADDESPLRAGHASSPEPVRPAISTKPRLHPPAGQSQSLPDTAGEMTPPPAARAPQRTAETAATPPLSQPRETVLGSQVALLPPMFQHIPGQPMYQQPMPYLPAPMAPMYGPQPYTGPGDQSLSVLLTETRQQNSELRVAVGRVADKVDSVSEKLERIRGQSSAVVSSLPMMQPDILLLSIQHMVQENERLKKELLEKSNRIDAQNEKISELLQRSQCYIEKSNILLEARNDTTASSHAKVLSLEQDKVNMSVELTAVTAQLGEMRTTVSATQRAERELQQRLDATVETEAKREKDSVELRLSNADNERLVAEVRVELRDEKQVRRRVEAEQSRLQETLAEMEAAHTATQKNAEERKKKSAEEKKVLEKEIDEQRAGHEAEVSSLKSDLRKQKSSTSLTATEQMSQMEAALNKDWQQKCDRALASCQKKHQAELLQQKDECSQLSLSIQSLECKVEKASGKTGDESEWKEKYERLREEMTEMRRQYEAERGQRGRSPEALITEVKKIMNNVYRQLRDNFSADQSYKGRDVQQVILATVKTVTMEVVRQQEEEEEEEEERGARESSDSGSQSEGEEADISPEQSEEEEDNEEKENKVLQSSSVSHGDEDPRADGTEDGSEDRRCRADVLAGLVPRPQAEEQGEDRNEVPVEDQQRGTKVEGPVNGETREMIETSTVSESDLVKDTTMADTHADTAADPTHADTTADPAHADTMADPTHADTTADPTHADTTADPAHADSESSPTRVDSLCDRVPDAAVERVPIATRGDALSTDTGLPVSAELGKGPSKGAVKEPMQKDDVIIPEVAMLSTQAKPLVAGIKPKVANITGDKGNPYYMEELKKDDIENIVAQMANVTGDKGNPHYAKELEKGEKIAPKVIKKVNSSKPEQICDEVIVPQVSAVSMQGKPPPDTSIKPKVANVTGDKGNPYYMEELRKDDIKNIVAQMANVTGDKGNPHYAKELEKCEQIAPKVIQKVNSSKPEEEISVANVSQVKGVKPSETGSGKNSSADVIVQTVAPPALAAGKPITPAVLVASHASGTGGRGNPHYAAELAKAASSGRSDASVHAATAPVDPVIKAQSSWQTGGDVGNPHYAAELDKGKHSSKDVKAKSTTDGKNVSSKPVTKAAAIQSLFGDEDVDSSIDFLSSVMAAKKKPTPKTAAKTASAASDADLKPKPPPVPLFDDDGDDLDWLK